MNTLRNNALFKTDIKHLVLTSTNTDLRIGVIEKLVADHYNTTVHELDVWYKNSDEKIMCCFLLHDLLNYTVSSLAHKYNIYPAFLQKNINEHYAKCLTDEAFFELVSSLKDAFFKDSSQ